VLATILHTETVGGRVNAVQVEPRTRDLVRGHRGRLIRTTADGIMATFDAPGQAIQCAAAVRDDAAAAGIQIRAGIHTGEVDLVGDDIAGPSVQITDRVAALARPAEILVSRTVKDLVTGASITFAERGSHILNGPPDEWPLFAVTGLGSPGGPALQVGPDASDAAVQVVQ
jgi:class 3 adenylate cyclase